MTLPGAHHATSGADLPTRPRLLELRPAPPGLARQSVIPHETRSGGCTPRLGIPAAAINQMAARTAGWGRHSPRITVASSTLYRPLRIGSRPEASVRRPAWSLWRVNIGNTASPG